MNVVLPWNERIPDRFEEEREILEAEGFILDQTTLQQEKYVKFTGKAKHDGRQVDVVFPFGYPSLHPHIFDTEASPLLFRHHNARNREFCLFGPGGVRWSATLTSKNALKEMEELLRLFSQLKEVDATDLIPEPITEVLSYEPRTAILVPETIYEEIDPNTGEFSRGTFELRYSFFNFPRAKDDIAGRGILYKVNHEGRRYQSNDYDGFVNKPLEISGQLFETNRVLSPGEANQAIKNCVDLAKGKGTSFAGWLCLVFKEATGDALHFRNGWLVAKVFPSGNIKLIRCYGASKKERFSRTPGLEALAEKKVGVIGCGCLGSKISASLAASGVGWFFLTDCDAFEPLNAVRHECGVDSFGLQKVEALARRLWSINPSLKGSIKAMSGQYGRMLNAQLDQDSVKAVASCDLVIDTTGVHGVSRFLNDVCYPAGVPVLYASVTNGAWGGEIVNSTPSQFPCWLCWLDQYYNQRPVAAPTPGHGVFHPGCGQPSFTGTSYEAGVVANVASWNAVDTLLRGEPGRKTFLHPYMVYEGRTGEGLPLLKWESLEIKHRPNCHVCGSLKLAR